MKSPMESIREMIHIIAKVHPALPGYTYLLYVMCYLTRHWRNQTRLENRNGIRGTPDTARDIEWTAGQQERVSLLLRA